MATRTLSKSAALLAGITFSLTASLCSGTDASPAPPADCAKAPDLSTVQVSNVTVSHETYDGKATAMVKSPRGGGEIEVPTAQLRREITVTVKNLQTLLDREKCPATKGKLVLFLDGRPIVSLVPYPRTDPKGGTLKFSLDRKETSREEWAHLLGKPNFGTRPVPVSVGFHDEFPVQSDAVIAFRAIPTMWFWAWFVLFVALVWGFLRLALRSDVLRDPGPQPQNGSRKPYSLARTQAACWFFLVLASYLFIGLVTGDYGTTITNTVLGLMGISAGTVVGAAVIDTGAPAAAPAAAGAPAAPPAPPAASTGTKGRWWLDILSDENGVNFHRFQMASWTLVLGVVFIQQVYRSLAMPDFDNTLLGLMGISSGTYLGLKITSEKR